MTPLQAKQRLRRIQAVKAAQRELQLDDSAYRAMLVAQTGKTSAADLSLDQLSKVLDHLRRCGAFKGQGTQSRRLQRPAPERAALIGKVQALLKELNKPLSYADAICQRNRWCDRLEFAEPETLHKLVGALSRTLAGRKEAALCGEDRP